MSAWIVLTTTDLNDYVVAAQAAALRTAALAVGQTDPFPRVMADIASRIRQKIRSGGYKVSVMANALPPELKWVGAYLVLEALQTRLPGLALNEDQKTQIERAVALLDRIADGKDEPSTPDDPESTADVQSPSFKPRITAPTREWTSANTDGL